MKLDEGYAVGDGCHITQWKMKKQKKDKKKHGSRAPNHVSLWNAGIGKMTRVGFVRHPPSRGFLAEDALGDAESLKLLFFKRSNSHTHTHTHELTASLCGERSAAHPELKWIDFTLLGQKLGPVPAFPEVSISYTHDPLWTPEPPPLL